MARHVDRTAEGAVQQDGCGGVKVKNLGEAATDAHAILLLRREPFRLKHQFENDLATHNGLWGEVAHGLQVRPDYRAYRSVFVETKVRSRGGLDHGCLARRWDRRPREGVCELTEVRRRRARRHAPENAPARRLPLPGALNDGCEQADRFRRYERLVPPRARWLVEARVVDSPTHGLRARGRDRNRRADHCHDRGVRFRAQRLAPVVDGRAAHDRGEEGECGVRPLFLILGGVDVHGGQLQVPLSGDGGLGLIKGHVV